ncbi:MAG TPA: VCBS repeat-containing protein [Verrucomicrobiae bacterium]|nr:VCBS repeat-containing protein [Verrucomicrobiae bacterium]
MIHRAVICAALGLATGIAAAQEKEPTFRKIQLTSDFWSEGAAYADFNHDGHMDIVSGPFWYEGPDFKTRHEYRHATQQSFTTTNAAGEAVTFPGFEGAHGEKNDYSDDFLTFTFDINGDGWPDVIVVGFPGKETYWYENPRGNSGLWTQHTIIDSTDDESPSFGDLFGDGKGELLCCTSNYLGYAAPADWKNPAEKWVFHRVSPMHPDYQRFLHGLGFGDVNGDGRNDLIIKDGWYEQPASCDGDPVWKFHPFPFAPNGSSTMFAYDVNGDGLADIITCLNPHGFGLAWYEQLPEKSADGETQFKQHLILNPDGTPNSYGVAFSQPHSVALVDIDGDGLKDIVTGKRFWAHGKHGPDPKSNDPAVLYWFKLVRGENHSADFVPHLIDSDSGVGTEVLAGDVNGDGKPDIVVGNKKGTFVFLQQ